MPMIDPKQIEEWRALAEQALRGGEWGWPTAFLANYSTALSALLAEREEMLQQLRGELVMCPDPAGAPGAFVQITVRADSAEQRQRTVEWLKGREGRSTEARALLGLLLDVLWDPSPLRLQTLAEQRDKLIPRVTELLKDPRL